MKKNILSALALILALTTLSTTQELHAGRGGAFAGGLFTGAVLSSAASRNSYRSDRDYIFALERENANLRDENADLRDALRAERRKKG